TSNVKTVSFELTSILTLSPAFRFIWVTDLPLIRYSVWEVKLKVLLSLPASSLMVIFFVLTLTFSIAPLTVAFLADAIPMKETERAKAIKKLHSVAFLIIETSNFDLLVF